MTFNFSTIQNAANFPLLYLIVWTFSDDRSNSLKDLVSSLGFYFDALLDKNHCGKKTTPLERNLSLSMILSNFNPNKSVVLAFSLHCWFARLLSWISRDGFILQWKVWFDSQKWRGFFSKAFTFCSVARFMHHSSTFCLANRFHGLRVYDLPEVFFWIYTRQRFSRNHTLLELPNTVK